MKQTPVSSLEEAQHASLEGEFIAVFVRVADTLSVPRSIGEIYGLLFCSERPLCFEDIGRRLRISAGSVSQGLRFLRAIGAVKPVYQPGERRDYFAAETSLRRLAAGFLKEKLEPHLEGGRERLEALEARLDASGEAAPAHLVERLHLLQNWQRQGGGLLPLIAQFLG